jgi:hypothetical protein
VIIKNVTRSDKSWSNGVMECWSTGKLDVFSSLHRAYTPPLQICLNQAQRYFN